MCLRFILKGHFSLFLVLIGFIFAFSDFLNKNQKSVFGLKNILFWLLYSLVDTSVFFNYTAWQISCCAPLFQVKKRSFKMCVNITLKFELMKFPG